MELVEAYTLWNAQWPPIMAEGWSRQWLKCHVCNRLQYYDYIPYSLQNPIMWSACGHELKRMHYLKETPLTLKESDDNEHDPDDVR
ncbi:hypothetical protein SAMN02799624_05339 [Paenibacillus sp. UNC496MF]|uniref:hypothetical protein n=1 Tax=Paenibacillus sp. UNC496MF TaxID=1502753 RepID=UPI0008EA7B4D|nr:hypothetical protein [Paenibacillus sp. UNC496MF]SFJ64404.1 hypothetical protein SAMN02799624_05339 [Paenibacillus sp. UNC496MF]